MPAYRSILSVPIGIDSESEAICIFFSSLDFVFIYFLDVGF